MAFALQYVDQDQIDSVVTGEGCTLDKVLESGDCFSQCMAGNPRWLDYICQPEQLEVMVELMMYDTSENASYRHLFSDTDRLSRLAYIASELIDSDSERITRSITESPEVLLKVFRYLDQPAPLGENRAYFVKVFTALIRNTSSQTDRVLQWWSEAKEAGTFDIIAGLMRHIGTCSVHLLTLLTQEEVHVSEDGEKFASWAMRNGLPEGFLQILSEEPQDLRPGTPDDEIEALDEAAKVGVIWVAVMVLSCDTSMTEEQALEVLPTSWLSSHTAPGASAVPSEFIPTVVQLYLQESRSNPASGVIPMASDLLQRVVRAYTGPTAIPQENFTTVVHTMTHSLECILKHSQEIKECLSKPPHACVSTFTGPIEMQTWHVPVPFGLVRLKMLELVRAIGLVDLKEVYSWFLDEGILSLLLTLFEQYSMNNMVHSLVIGTVRSLVTAGDEDVDRRLVHEVHLVEWLTTMYRKGHDTHAPYVGYLHELLTLISSFDESRGYTAEGDWAYVREGLVEETKRRLRGASDVMVQAQDGERRHLDDDELGVVNLDIPPPTPGQEAPADAEQIPHDAQSAMTRAPAPRAQPLNWETNLVSEPDDTAQLVSLFNTPADAAKQEAVPKPEAPASAGGWISFSDEGGSTPDKARPSSAPFQQENPIRSPTSPVCEGAFNGAPTFVDLPPFPGDGAPPLDRHPPSPIQTSSPPSVPDKKSNLFSMSVDELSVTPPSAAKPVAASRQSVQSDDDLFPQAPLSGAGSNVSNASSDRSSTRSIGDDLWKNIAGSLDSGLSGKPLAPTGEVKERKTLAELQAEQQMRQAGQVGGAVQQQQQQQQAGMGFDPFSPTAGAGAVPQASSSQQPQWTTFNSTPTEATRSWQQF